MEARVEMIHAQVAEAAAIARIAEAVESKVAPRIAACEALFNRQLDDAVSTLYIQRHKR